MTSLSITDDGFLLVFTAASCLIVLLITVFWFLRKRKSARRHTVALVGPLRSGKTATFSALVYDEILQTKTSLCPNQSPLDLGNGKSIILQDIPGHVRLRRSFLSPAAPFCCAIVFVLDASTIIRDTRPVAEYLYDVLALAPLSGLPVLILCNKKDIVTAPKKTDRIIQKLESEFTEIRQTRSATEQGLGKDGDESISYLGSRDSSKFEFSQLKNRIDFELVSLRNNTQETTVLVKQWIHSVVRAVSVRSATENSNCSMELPANVGESQSRQALIEDANRFKEQGNELMKDGNVQGALRAYHKAHMYTRMAYKMSENVNKQVESQQKPADPAIAQTHISVLNNMG
eukprot:gene3421-8295_t